VKPRIQRWLWLAALLPYAWFVARSFHLIDDAFISFHYAQHWAHGEGLRFNPGGGVPVEGFSNFLWVALLAGGERLGVLPEVLAPWMGIAAGVLLLARVQRFALGTLELGGGGSLACAMFLACFPPFAVWSTGGLETSAFALVLFSVWAEVVRPGGARWGRAAGLALVLIALRPEGIAWALGLVLAAAVAQGRAALDRRFLDRYVLPVSVGLAILLAARWWYFHDLVPNTVRAKGGFSLDTLARGAKNAASYGLIFLSPAILLVLLPLAWKHSRGGLAASASLMFVGGMVWSLVVGGDWMPFFRFHAPLTPFLALLLGVISVRWGPRGFLFAGALTLSSVLPAFDLLLVPRGLRESLYFRSFTARGYETEQARMGSGLENARRYKALGLALAGIAEPGDSLVQGAIGAVGYYSGVTIHDRNGLVDRAVAREGVSGVRSAGHDKLVPRVFFADREPTWFEVRQAPPHPSAEQIRARAAPVFRQFPEDRRLLELCEPQVIEVPARGPGGRPFSLLLFRRVDSKERARRAWEAVGLP